MKLLYHLNILKFNQKKIQKWIDSDNYQLLKLALLKGRYKDKTFILEKLSESQCQFFIHEIIALLKDPVETVSKAAISILRKIDSSGEYQALIAKTEKDWVIRKAKQAEREERMKDPWYQRSAEVANSTKFERSHSEPSDWTENGDYPIGGV